MTNLLTYIRTRWVIETAPLFKKYFIVAINGRTIQYEATYNIRYIPLI